MIWAWPKVSKIIDTFWLEIIKGLEVSMQHCRTAFANPLVAKAQCCRLLVHRACSCV